MPWNTPWPLLDQRRVGELGHRRGEAVLGDYLSRPPSHSLVSPLKGDEGEGVGKLGEVEGVYQIVKIKTFFLLKSISSNLKHFYVFFFFT